MVTILQKFELCKKFFGIKSSFYVKKNNSSFHFFFGKFFVNRGTKVNILHHTKWKNKYFDIAKFSILLIDIDFIFLSLKKKKKKKDI